MTRLLKYCASAGVVVNLKIGIKVVMSCNAEALQWRGATHEHTLLVRLSLVADHSAEYFAKHPLRNQPTVNKQTAANEEQSERTILLKLMRFAAEFDDTSGDGVVPAAALGVVVVFDDAAEFDVEMKSTW